MCAVLASFDMANVRSLHAVFFAAVDYACRFSLAGHADTRRTPSQAGHRPAWDIGSGRDSACCRTVQLDIRGRTVGPPVPEFLALLCAGDYDGLRRHVNAVKPAGRTRNGASYLATLLIYVKAAGIPHVLLCCDQLEDFAATTTTKQKRRSRSSDSATTCWRSSQWPTCSASSSPCTLARSRRSPRCGSLADLPSYEHDRQENRHRVVVLDKIHSAERTQRLRASISRLPCSLRACRPYPLTPFTADAIEVLFTRSDGKPRDILRKANSLIERGAEENWDR